MKNVYAIIGFVGLFGAVALSGCENSTSAGSDKPSQESDQQQIKEVLSGIVAAAQAGDPNAYITFVTEDAVMMWDGQPAVIGHKAIHEFMSGFSGDTGFDFQGQTDEIQVVGDWALHRHSGVATMVPTDGGEATQLDRKYIDILRHVDGEWKISHHIYNLNVPSSPD